MTKRKQHIDEKAFQRYLNNKMTNAERNAFEKDLQKNPFEAEALEGFEMHSSSNIYNDLTELKSKLTKRKSRIPYFAAAATILLLITSGIIWMQLDKQNPLPKTTEVKQKKEVLVDKERKQAQLQSQSQLSENKELNLQLEESKPQQPAEENTKREESVAPLKSTRKKQTTTTTELEGHNKMPLIQPSEKTENKLANIKTESVKHELDAAPVNRAQNVQIASVPKKNIVRGRVISADDQMPLPGVSIIEKGTTKGTVTNIDGQFEMQLESDSSILIANYIGMEINEFQAKKDSNLIALKPDNIGLDEVVTVGYGTQRKQTITKDTATVAQNITNAKAAPKCGMESYNNYLEEKAILEPKFQKNKVVLKLSLHINQQGKIVNAEYSGTDTVLFERAKEIVQNGPTWNPKYENGIPISSEIDLKIVFRKEKDGKK